MRLYCFSIVFWQGGIIDIKKEGTLQLTSGAYFFERFDIDKDAFLEITLTTGPLDINVTGKVDNDKDLTMSIAPLGASDSRYVRIN